ncbi:MAG TPA: competence/damage-inducible protein A [Kofleriaceae bacterium]|jgi:molybdenum cofactor synthesis domain-containing protein|nr:competence/damage-inducible protein A [Kofleriaceae bacterium]
MPTAGIVIIGDEILSGKFAEENAAFLIGELRALGVDLRRITFVPDDPDDIAHTVLECSRRFDYVFTSGGVGPTHDDITMAAIARGFGTTITRHPDLETRIRAYWKDKLADANLRLADIPEGAELVYGKDQIWPVVALQNVFIMPGVPALFRRKFVDIRDRFRSEPVTAARLYVDIEEGELAPSLDAVVVKYPSVKIGSYPRFSEKDFKVLVTLEGASAADVTGAFQMLDASLGVRVIRREEPQRVGA